MATVAVAVLLAAAALLNARSLAKAWARHRPSEIARARIFYVLFGGILLLGVVCRVVWTRHLLFPGTTPDGYTYLLPALEHPRLPLDEARPLAFPYLIAFSLAVFGHPIGILVVHNLLALGSSAVLTLAIRRRLGLSVVSLVLLFYMLFSAKNAAFEYLLLTEHLARCLVALIFGILLWVQRPRFPIATLLAFLTVAAILTKPNAVAFIPGVLSGFLVDRWLTGGGDACWPLRAHTSRS